jgi:hypothetical protein
MATTRKGRIVAAVGVVVCAATVTACGEGTDRTAAPEAPPAVGVFKLHVRALNGPGLRTEWIDVSSGRWRIEQEGETIIYTGEAIVTDSGPDGVDVRTGSRTYLGPLVERTIAKRALRSYLAGSAGRAGVTVSTSAGGETRLRFRRGDIAIQATVKEVRSAAAADALGLFTPPTNVRTWAREVAVGAKASMPVRAYWLGPTVAGRRAVTATEHYTPLTNELLASPGWGPTDEAIVHSTYYELASAGGKSSALPGQAPPDGELRVVSQPVEAVLARAAIAAYNGHNGNLEYEAWPRQAIKLANGEPAVVIPDRGESVGSMRESFAVVTKTTLINVVGRIAVKDMPSLAAQLRPL